MRSVGIIDQVSLNGSFKNVDSFTYQDSIGKAIFEYCKVIPHGVLCFLPSYTLLQKLTERWKLTGLWRELEKVKILMLGWISIELTHAISKFVFCF